MAAEPTKIKLKRSTTATVVPTTSNITNGEVALNIADRKLYVNNAGTIVEIANQKPNTGEVTTSMFATDITHGPGNVWYVAKNGADTTTLGNGGAGGYHGNIGAVRGGNGGTATGGDINIPGGDGHNGTDNDYVPSGTNYRSAANGGGSFWGSGGRGGSHNIGSRNGQAYGAGGGAGSGSNSGAGAPGQIGIVVVEEFA